MRLDLHRHRTLGELIGQTFELFWRHLATFLTLTLLLIIVPGVWLAVRWYFGAQAAVVDRLARPQLAAAAGPAADRLDRTRATRAADRAAAHLGLNA